MGVNGNDFAGVILAKDGDHDGKSIAIGGGGAGKTYCHALFETVEQIWLVKPHKIDLAGRVGDSGNLDIFVVFGVDILDEGDAAADGDVLMFLDVGNGNEVAEVYVSMGEMVQQLVGGVDI